MTICRYFQQGNCRFGERCKFEHPGQVTQARAPQQTQNRYGALNNQFGGGAARAPPRNGPNNKYNLDQEAIRIDLTTDRPIWPFSAYGPAKAVPRQLIEGAIEQSPEEIRFRFYALGNPQQAAAEEAALLEQSNQQVQSILNDLSGAIKFVLDGDNMHPNRNDICEQTSSQTSNTFSRGGNGASSRPVPTGPAAFGANKPSGFGQPSFGAPGGGQQQQQQQQQSAFGRPSSFSQPNQGGGAFGAPSSLGANNSSAGGAFGKPAFGAPAFGQPANPGQNQPQTQPAAFGQPSQPGVFGQPAGSAFGKPAFGQASQPGGGAFGQPSQPGGAAFGQPSQPGGAAFGQPSQPSSGAFGQPSQPGGAAFGQPSQPGGGIFGKPAATPGFGQPAFGQPAAPQNSGGFPPAQSTGGAFGNPQAQQQQPTPSPFGQPTQAQPSNPFQQQQQQPTTTGGGLNAFGQPAAATQQQQPNGTTTTTTTSLPSSVTVHPATHDPSTNRLITWKGQRVEYPAPNVPCYRDPSDRSGALIRIWHPTPPAEANPFHEGPPAAYEGDAGRALADAYAFVRETGTWRDGVVPEVPPKGEWVGWDV